MTGKSSGEEKVLVETAKALGKAAGKLAALAGAGRQADAGDTGAPRQEPAPAPGKLAPKNKSRLPRRQKKALKKQQNAA